MLTQLLRQPHCSTNRIIIVILCLLLLPINNASATLFPAVMSDGCPPVMTNTGCCADTMTSHANKTNHSACQDDIQHSGCLPHCQSSCHTTLILPATLAAPVLMASSQSDHPYLSGYWDEPVSTLLRPPIHL